MSENRDFIFTSDLPKDFLRTSKDLINSYSTGLVRITYPPEPPEDVRLIGSGTFIRIGSLCGILTAYHVLERLYCPCELGLVLVEGEQRPTIPVEYLDLVEIAVPGIPGEGPDLAFIGLPPSRVEGISMFKSFYDLGVDREEMITSPPNPNSAIWFVNGIPDEFTVDEPSTGAFEVTKFFHGLCGAGGANRIYDEEGYDYIEVIVEYEEEATLPTTFGGISGGGLWQVTIQPGSGDLRRDRYLLSGMPFAETKAIIDGKRTIFCHGPRSIYDVSYTFLEALKTRRS